MKKCPKGQKMDYNKVTKLLDKQTKNLYNFVMFAIVC